jgi:thioredoxin-related protein
MLLTFIVSCLSAAAYAQTDEGVQFNDNTPMKDIYAKAKADKKMILVDCYTSWCGPCKMMAKKEFPKKEMGDYFNPKYVSVKIDMEKGEGPKLLKQWDVNAFPTALILDADGKVLFRLVGYRTSDKFIKDVQEGIENGPFGGLDKKYEAGDRSVELVQKYLGMLKNQYATETYHKIADNFLKDNVDKILTDKSYCDIFLNYSEMSPYNDLFLQVYKRKADFKITEEVPLFNRVMNDTWITYPNTKREFFDIKGEGRTASYTLKADMLNDYYAYMEKCGIKNVADIKTKIQLRNFYMMPYLSNDEFFDIAKTYVKKGDIEDEIIAQACSGLYKSNISDSKKKVVKGWIENRIKALTGNDTNAGKYFSKFYNEILNPTTKK